tara:strand:+ start:519 stop:950 length:432 start_codon:yes stop_codon:yes gene_type:complete
MAEYVDSLGVVMNCDTIPNYDQSFNPFDDYWVCGDWITFHKMLKNQCGYTQEEANNRVIQLWNDRWLFGHSWFCQWDQEFRDYFISQGSDFHPLVNVTNNLLNTTENLTAGVGDLSKYIRIALPITILGIGLYYGVKAYKELK